MSRGTNLILRFFRELKRRKVYRVLALYAGAAFVTIELANNVVDPLHLPNWLPTVVILILIIGFPVVAVLSWFFDLTPGGIHRTEPLGALPEDEAVENKRRRLRVSDILIAILLIAVIILIYPRIFDRDDLRKTRDSDGRVALAVLQFENLTGDTVFNVWQNGVQDLLITSLSGSEELMVRQYRSVNSVIGEQETSLASLPPRLLSDLGKKLQLRTLLTGSLMKADSKIRMDVQLIDTEAHEIYRTFSVHGASEDDIFHMVDTLSWQIRNYMEIRNIQDRSNSTLVGGTGYTKSSEAFRYYIHGMDAIMKMDMGQSAQWFTRAVELDSNFVNAWVFLAHALHMNKQDRQARELVAQLSQKKDALPLIEKLLLEHLNAYFFQTPIEEAIYAKQLLELDEMNPFYWHMLAVAHYKIEEFDAAIEAWETLFKLHETWGSEWLHPFSYIFLADAYFEQQEYEEQARVLRSGYQLFPQNGYIQTQRLVLALVRKDSGNIDQIKKEYLDYRHNVTHCPEALISNDLGYIYTRAGQLERAEEQHRIAIAQAPNSMQFQFNLAKFLIDEGINVEEGHEIVDRILEQVPGQWALLSYKGWSLYKMGKHDEALVHLRAGWEKRPLYNHLYYKHLQEAENAASEENSMF